MRKSLITDDFEKCYLCGGRKECIHHVFEGNGRRMLSERYGLIVSLCHRCHNMSSWAVHFNKPLDLKLKQIAQDKFERNGGTREQFIKIFGRNYL